MKQALDNLRAATGRLKTGTARLKQSAEKLSVFDDAPAALKEIENDLADAARDVSAVILAIDTATDGDDEPTE